MQGRIEDAIGSATPHAASTSSASPRPAPARSARPSTAACTGAMAVTDVLSIGAASVVAHWIRYGIGLPRGDFFLLLAG